MLPHFYLNSKDIQQNMNMYSPSHISKPHRKAFGSELPLDDTASAFLDEYIATHKPGSQQKYTKRGVIYQ